MGLGSRFTIIRRNFGREEARRRVRVLLAPLMRRRFQCDIEQNLRRIKALVEAEPTG